MSARSEILKNARFEARQRKSKKIHELLLDNNSSRQLVDHLTYFRRFATTNGGLLEDEYRLHIWPILAQHLPMAEGLVSLKMEVDCDLIGNESSCSDSDFFESARSSFSSTASTNGDFDEDKRTSRVNDCTLVTPSIEELQTHVEWNQVELDVNRTLARFPPNISETERLTLQSDLTPMIVELLYLNKTFRYYQGFHDVCLTILLALDIDRAKRVVNCLAERSSLRNYLTKSLEESALKELGLVYVILHHCDPEVENVLREAELGTLFALSWPITWFSHALHSFDQVLLCFDLFLSTHYLMPIYVSAALVEHRRQEILICEPEMPSLHHLLNNVPNNFDLQSVLDRALDLFSLYPPGLVQGVYLREYDEMCARENRVKRHAPPPVRRHSALTTPWMMVGTAAAGMAAYWWLSKYTNDVSSFF